MRPQGVCTQPMAGFISVQPSRGCGRWMESDLLPGMQPVRQWPCWVWGSLRSSHADHFGAWSAHSPDKPTNCRLRASLSNDCLRPLRTLIRHEGMTGSSLEEPFKPKFSPTNSSGAASLVLTCDGPVFRLPAAFQSPHSNHQLVDSWSCHLGCEGGESIDRSWPRVCQASGTRAAVNPHSACRAAA